jgi:hypothetical protein
MQPLNEFGVFELIFIWALCLGLGALAMALATRWIFATALLAVILGGTTIHYAEILYHYEHAQFITGLGRLHFWSYFAAASIGFVVSVVFLIKHALREGTRPLVLVLRWVVTPVVLGAVLWLAIAALSIRWSQGSVDVRTMIIVIFAIPVASLAACRYEHLVKPSAVDHARQSGLLYVSWLELGQPAHDFRPWEVNDFMWIERDYVFLIAILMNLGVLIFWRQIQRDV